MKNAIIVLLTCVTFIACAAPHHAPARPAPAPRPMQRIAPRPAPMPAARPAHHHSHSTWGKGGSNFWPGFAGGLVGSLLMPPPPRPIITSSVIVGPVRVQPTMVLVPAHYEQQVQPNGTILLVYVPEHYEYR